LVAQYAPPTTSPALSDDGGLTMQTWVVRKSAKSLAVVDVSTDSVVVFAEHDGGSHVNDTLTNREATSRKCE
jgi:hypothetical protein